MIEAFFMLHSKIFSKKLIVSLNLLFVWAIWLFIYGPLPLFALTVYIRLIQNLLE